MKGIVLAGGSGTRLHPITKGVSKQLLPVYDKPMIYYPISVLMLAGIREILIITTPEHQQSYINLLGNGEAFGLNLSYEIQYEPKGLAQAFTIGRDFIGDDSVCLVLGDNIFWGAGFADTLRNAANRENGATIFSYQVKNPSSFGIIEFDNEMNPISIEEKPSHPKSEFAITGLYFFDNNVVNIAPTVVASKRGELEITDIIDAYLEKDCLKVEMLGRGYAWLDTGTHETLLASSTFVETIETRQGYKVACLEEIAYTNSWISFASLQVSGEMMAKTTYGKYLLSLTEK